MAYEEFDGELDKPTEFVEFTGELDAPEQDAQEVITSARAWRGAGAGRGAATDPRRLDTQKQESVLQGVRMEEPQFDSAEATRLSNRKYAEGTSDAERALSDPRSRAPSMTEAKGKLIPINESGIIGRSMDLVGSQVDQYSAGLGYKLGDAASAVGADGVAESLRNRASNLQTRADTTNQSVALSADGALEKYAPQILAVFPTMAVAAATGGLPIMFGISEMQSYAESRKAGKSPLEALMRAVPMGAAEVLGEKLGGTGKLLDALENVAVKGFNATALKELSGKMLASGMREVPSEEATYAAQFGIDKTSDIGLNQDATLKDFVEGAKDTAIVAAGAGGAMAGGSVAVSKIPTGAAPQPSAFDLAKSKGFLVPMSQRAPAAPATVNFTDPSGPVGQAGITPVVVPIRSNPNAAAPNVGTPSESGGVAAGAADGGSNLPAASVGDAGLAPVVPAGVVSDPAAPSPTGADAAPVRGGAGEPAAAVAPATPRQDTGSAPANPVARTSDADLLARVPKEEVQPEEIVMRRGGGGYGTQADAQAAVASKQTTRSDLDWRVEPMENGRFRIAGYTIEASNKAAEPSKQVAPAATAIPATAALQQGAVSSTINQQEQTNVSTPAQMRNPDVEGDGGAGSGGDAGQAVAGGVPAVANQTARAVPASVSGAVRDSVAVRASAQAAVDRAHASNPDVNPKIVLGDPDPQAVGQLEKAAKETAEAFGTSADVVFFSDPDPKSVNGFELGGRVYVNTRGLGNNALRTGWHETHHILQARAEADDSQGRTGTPSQRYRDQVDSIFDDMSDDGKRSYITNFLHADELSGLDEAAKTKKVDELLSAPFTRREMVADFVGNRATDRTFIKSLAKADPVGFKNFARRWLKVIDNLIGQLRGNGSNKESAAVDKYVADLNKSRMVLRDAMVELRKADARATPVTKGEASLSRRQMSRNPDDYNFGAGDFDANAGNDLGNFSLDFTEDAAEEPAPVASRNVTTIPTAAAQAGPTDPGSVTAKDMLKHGIFAERAFDYGTPFEDGRHLNLNLPRGFPYVPDDSVAINSDGTVTLGWFMNSWLKDVSRPVGVAWARGQVVKKMIAASGYDLANAYRKGTVQRLATTWREIGKKSGAFRLKDSQRRDMMSIADDMGAFKKYNFLSTGSRFSFTEKQGKNGAPPSVFSASISTFSDGTFECCTMGLANSGDLGNDFYAVTSMWAMNNGKAFEADSTLSGINTYRRTEQALSFAIKTGRSDVIRPGPQNRVYGYDPKASTEEDHNRNIARLALASMRNVAEVFPYVRSLRYNAGTDMFTDRNGRDAEKKVSDFLDRTKNPDAGVLGFGRSTIARAVVTGQIIVGDMTGLEGDRFEKPIAYSRKQPGLDSPLSESWGEEGDVNPKLKEFLGDSVMQHKDGTPIPMYHGTARDITQFKAKQAGAIFLTENPNFAEDFAESSKDWMLSHYDEILTPEQIVKARKEAAAEAMSEKSYPMTNRRELKAQIEDEANKPTGEAKDFFNKALSKYMPTGPNIMPLVVRAENPFDYRKKQHRDYVIEQLFADNNVSQRGDGEEVIYLANRAGSSSSRGMLEYGLSDGDWSLIEEPEMQAAIRALGHDSFYVKENGQVNLGVYEPTQIKSAIGNNGNFDREDPRISFSKKQTPEQHKAALVKKFERMRRFHADFSELLQRIDKDAPFKEEAAILRLIARTGFRIGGDPLEGKEAYGASTLKPTHVRVNGDTVYFDFMGKAQVPQKHNIVDPAIAKDMRARIATRGDKLFSKADRAVRKYLDSIIAGKDYKVHDFRTYVATSEALEVMKDIPPPENAQEFRAGMEIVGSVAAVKIGDQLGVTLEHYVDPQIFEEWRKSAGVEDSTGVQEGAGKGEDELAEAKDAGAGSRNDGSVLRKKSKVAFSRKQPTYAMRPVANATDIIEWAKSQGFKTTVPAADLHATIAYSSTPMDPTSVDVASPSLTVEGGKRTVEKLGDAGAVVLKLSSKDLRDRWQHYRDSGASWDYDGYTPHVTITYEGNDVDLSKVQPYTGPIVFGPEEQSALEEGKDFKEVKVSASLKQRAPGLPEESRFMSIRRTLQDQFIQIKVLQDTLTARGGTVGEAQDVYRAEERLHGRGAALLTDFANHQIKPFIDKVSKAKLDINEVALYAYALHAKERNAYIKSINPKIGDAGSGMSDAEADTIVQLADLSGDRAKFDELQQDLMGITSTTRRVMLDEGLITQDEYDGWENLYQNYVPLRGFEGVDAETGKPRPGVGRGYSITGKESIKALGRNSKAGHILENIIRDYERAVARSERNAVAKTFLDLATSNPDPALWEVQPVKYTPSFNKASGMVLMRKADDTGEDTIAIKVAGQSVRVKINDPLVLRSMKLAAKDETSQLERLIANSLGTYTNLLRNTLTRYNPVFGAINAVRDAQMGAVSAFDELGARGMGLYAKHLPAALAASWRSERDKVGNGPMDRYMAEMRFAGGSTGGFHTRNLDEITDTMQEMLLAAGSAPTTKVEWVKSTKGYRMAKWVMKWLEIVGSTSEDAARVAGYRAAREMGKTPGQAASVSKNLTTNFNRKGEWGQTLNSLYLFFNAGVQGSTRVIEALGNPKVRYMMAGATAAAMSIALLNAGMGDDDDEQAYWDKIPDYEKERNLIFMLPPGAKMEGATQVGKNGRYIKIPMPYGLNIFAVLGNAMADMARYAKDPSRGKKPAKAAINLVSAVFGSFNPFGGGLDVTKPIELGMALAPTALDLPIQLATGSNSFGRPVGPEKSPFDDKPDSENFSARQAGTAAQYVARWLNSVTGGNEARAGAIDLMPGTLDNLVRNTTGGLGVFVADTFVNLPTKLFSPVETTTRDIPLWRNFYGGVDDVTDMGLFYDRRTEVTKIFKEAQNEMKLGIEVKYDDESVAKQALGKAAESYTQWMTKLRKEEIRIAADEDMTRGEKQIARKEIEKQRAQIAQSFNQLYNEQTREAVRAK